MNEELPMYHPMVQINRVIREHQKQYMDYLVRRGTPEATVRRLKITKKVKKKRASRTYCRLLQRSIVNASPPKEE